MTATSARGKQGFAVRISDIRKDLKANHGLSREEVVRSINYLMSQGWIQEEQVHKSFPLPSGTVIPQATSYYKISAAGTDKIEGPGEFTMDKFRGIRIEAAGQNVITVGDGNQVNARYQEAAAALVDLKHGIVDRDTVSESEKMDAVADIDSIQSQLARDNPRSEVIKGAWEGLKKFDTVVGLAEKVAKVAILIAPFLKQN
ncbi:MAG: hypothetical protein WD906_00075 [Anaerolineales bacterium]